MWANFDVNSTQNIYELFICKHIFWWLSPFARLKENYKYYRMSWAKTLRLPYDFCHIPYDFCHIFNSRTVEQSETWFKRSGKLTTSLSIFNVSNLSKLLKHLTVKNVCSVWSWFFRVFLLPLYQPAGLFLLLPQKRTVPPLQTWSFGNWGISLGEYPRIFPKI